MVSKTRISGGGRRMALVMAAMMALLVSPVRGQDRLAITWPTDSVLVAGQTVTIQWSGGDPSWQIYITLGDIDLWAATAIATHATPNTGAFEWTIPLEDSYGSTCGRRYFFYVQEVGVAQWAYGPVFTVECEQAVEIDIHPDSGENSINPRSRGVMPVALLTTSDFDAADVDLSSILFGRSGTEAAPDHLAFEDVDNDGDLDLSLKFRTQATGVTCGDSSLTLTGATLGGRAIQGVDAIRTVGCK